MGTEETVEREGPKREKPETEVMVSAILAITAMVAYGLHLGHNGTLLAAGVALVAMIGGVKIGELREKKRYLKP